MVQQQVTALLEAMVEGDDQAVNALMPIIYDELRRIAHRKLRGERPGHTLNTTALVHEAYLKLVNLDRIQWQSRAHFLGVAAVAMRQILVNYATQRRAIKRGGGQQNVPLDGLEIAAEARSARVLALDEALNRLAQLNERQAKVVTLRFFGGLNIEETAEALHISSATVKRDWTVARAWLNRELESDM